MIRTSRLRAWSLGVIALAGCDGPFGADDGLRRGSISLVVSGDIRAQTALPDPYTSVIDSVYASVRGSDGEERVFAKRLGRREGGATFPLELPDGQAVVAVRVISTTAVQVGNDQPVVSPRTLMDGTDTTNIVGDGFVLRVRVGARAPILVLSPDSVRLARPPATTTVLPFQANFTLYNRGSSALQFSMFAPGFSFARLSLGPNTTATLAGTILPDSQAIIRIVQTSTTALTSPVTVTITSQEGRVPLIVRPP